MKSTMRTMLLMGMVAALGACAGITPSAHGYDSAEGHWRGFVTRSGSREAVTVDLEQASSGWLGILRAGENTVPLVNVMVGVDAVHFEAPGEGTFDGTFAAGSMTGSLSGPSAGSFSLSREPADHYGPVGAKNASEGHIEGPRPDFILGL